MTLSNEFTRKRIPEIRSYEQANEYLGKKDSRPLRYKTRVNRRGENIAITHHDTDIITFNPNGNVIIDTNGYHTKTTKDRLNTHLPFDFKVYQEDSIWYVSKDAWIESMRKWINLGKWVFKDGITIGSLGQIVGAGKDDGELKKLNKKILKYSREYIKALFAGEVPKPSGGDCWYCSMRVTGGKNDGKSLGEATKDNHLQSHFEEKYYVPSLLVRAIEVFPVSKAAMWALGDFWGNNEEPMNFAYDVAKQQLRSALRRYLRRQLGLAS